MALSGKELAAITQVLGHDPNPVERRIFEVLWSEHCSYRHSRVFLKRFETTHRFGAVGAGENAGGVMLSGGREMFFKIESHNHPSHIEPQEGAATGVGGILRDIVAMGAQPIMTGDLLCFGLPQADPWMQRLIPGVVKGISDYGNSIGIPNGGGDTVFDLSYQQNILVNVFALGIRESGCEISTRLKDPSIKTPLDIHIFGSKTGRDGIGGAAMASETFVSDLEQQQVLGHKRPQVQISDPYMGKRIMEISLRLVRGGLIEALQDCGAAGLAGGVFEVCAKNDWGAELHLDRVPLRNSWIAPDEIVVSESQERMVAVARCDVRGEIESICHQWDVPHAIVGTLEPKRSHVNIWFGKDHLCQLDPKFVCEGHRPLYEHVQPRNRKKTKKSITQDRHSATNQQVKVSALSQRWISSLSGCSRSWIVDQYDQHVGGRTILASSEGPVSVQVATSDLSCDMEHKEVIGVRLSQSPKWFSKAPTMGAMQMLREAVSQLRASGLTPVGITNGLNFASPEQQSVLDDFDDTVAGLTQAAQEYELPVVSGNVSFYNASESDEGDVSVGIAPTLALGVAGVGDMAAVSPHPTRYPNEMEIFRVLRNGTSWGCLWDDIEKDFDVGRFCMDKSFDRFLWRLFSEVRPTAVFFSTLKPVWLSFLPWIMRQHVHGRLANLDAFLDIQSFGGHSVWLVVPKGQVLPPGGVKTIGIEPVGTIERNHDGQMGMVTVGGKDIVAETMDLGILRKSFVETFSGHSNVNP